MRLWLLLWLWLWVLALVVCLLQVKKHLRAQEIALQNKLPCIYLVGANPAMLSICCNAASLGNCPHKAVACPHVLACQPPLPPPPNR